MPSPAVPQPIRVADFRCRNLSGADFPALGWRRAMNKVGLRRSAQQRYGDPQGTSTLRTACLPLASSCHPLHAGADRHRERFSARVRPVRTVAARSRRSFRDRKISLTCVPRKSPIQGRGSTEAEWRDVVAVLAIAIVLDNAPSRATFEGRDGGPPKPRRQSETGATPPRLSNLCWRRRPGRRECVSPPRSERCSAVLQALRVPSWSATRPASSGCRTRPSNWQDGLPCQFRSLCTTAALQDLFDYPTHRIPVDFLIAF